MTGSGGGSFKFMPGNTNLDPLILLICANLVGVVSCMAAILLRVSPSTKTWWNDYFSCQTTKCSPRFWHLMSSLISTSIVSYFGSIANLLSAKKTCTMLDTYLLCKNRRKWASHEAKLALVRPEFRSKFLKGIQACCFFPKRKKKLNNSDCILSLEK